MDCSPNPCKNPWRYKPKNFQCGHCGRFFEFNWLLERHVQSKVCLTGRKTRGPAKERERVVLHPLERVSERLQRQPVQQQQQQPAGAGAVPVPVPFETDIDIRLPENFKIYLSGPARSGKTTLCYHLLRCLDDITRSPLRKRLWVYRQWQPIYDQMQGESLVSEFIECSDETEDNLKMKVEEYMAEQAPFLLILDDCMHASRQVQEWISKLFTTDARHRLISVVYIRQKFFGDKEFVREIDRNADVIILTENRREQGKICRQLASQMGTTKAGVLNQICVDATQRRADGLSGYLWVNLSNHIDSRFMYMTNVLEDQGHVVMTYEMMPGGGFKKMMLISKIRYNDLKAQAEQGQQQGQEREQTYQLAAAEEAAEEEEEAAMQTEASPRLLRTLPSKRQRDDDESVDDPAPVSPPRSTTPPLPEAKRARETLAPSPTMDSAPPMDTTPARPATPPPPPTPTPPRRKRPRDDDDNDRPGLAGVAPQAKKKKKRDMAPAPPAARRSSRQASAAANREFTTCHLCGQTFPNALAMRRHVDKSHRYGT